MLLIALMPNKPKESLIHNSKNQSIAIDEHTRVEKHDHFEFPHNRPLSKLQIRISDEQYQLQKGTNKHSEKHDKQDNVLGF